MPSGARIASLLVLTLMPGLSMAMTPATGSVGVLSQAQGLPAEFNEHFFDVPLAVRIDLDGQPLGEALIALDRRDRVQLVEFVDSDGEPSLQPLRQRWAAQLADPVPLGTCVNDCRNELLALHYSLHDSRLSILTRSVERSTDSQRYHALPEHGSQGLILRNQLNISAGQQEQTSRYALQGQGSLGDWTALGQVQADRSQDSRQGTRRRVDQLYAERLIENHFYRLGYFMPDSQGLARQPRTLGDSPDTALGVMFGSSDSLAVSSASPSATPIYVTPTRAGVVEIYRGGVLINSQPVQPGLQAIDTKVLPGGIYDVEVRVLEDGRVTSSSEAFIYKPSNWSNPDERWRYNLYLGQRSTLLSNWDEDRDNSLSAGALFNYRPTPAWCWAVRCSVSGVSISTACRPIGTHCRA